VRDEISKLAKRIGRQVVIHKRDDINSVDPLTQVFGEPKNKLASKPDEPVRIVHDETTGSFMLLFIKDCMVEMRGIDYQKFQSNFSKLFDSLEEWMQEFFGLKTLFAYIYDGEKNSYVKSRLQLLHNLTSEYRAVVKHAMKDHTNPAQDNCIILEKDAQSLFQEWYNSRDPISHQEFRTQHDIRRARLNTDC
jgi:hypothetical protein